MCSSHNWVPDELWLSGAAPSGLLLRGIAESGSASERRASDCLRTVPRLSQPETSHRPAVCRSVPEQLLPAVCWSAGPADSRAEVWRAHGYRGSCFSECGLGNYSQPGLVDGIGALFVSVRSLLIADHAGYAAAGAAPLAVQVRSASSSKAGGSTDCALLRISMPARRP